MSNDEYKEITCSINGEECYEGKDCDDCDVAQKEKDFEIKEKESTYQLNFSIKIKGKEFKRNGRNTVLKADISDLNLLKEFVKVTSEPILYDGNKYIWDISRCYPEWEKTKELLKIEGNPDKIIYEHDKPLFVFYDNEFYMIAPKI